MVEIDIQVQDARTRRALRELKEKSIPYAATLAISRTTIGARDAVRRETRNQFDLHTDFIPRGVRARTAKVSEMKVTGRARAEVYTAPIISTFMPIHEWGGERESARGGNIAVPASSLRSKAYQTARGSVRPQWKPKVLLVKNRNRGRYIKQGGVTIRVASGRRRGTAFIITTRSGDQMIVRRSSRAPYPLEFLYSLTPDISIEKRWNFEATVRGYADRNLRRNLFLAIGQAIKTAR